MVGRSKKKKINWDKIGQKVKDGFDSVANQGSKVMDLATKAGIAYVGFNALKHPAGALTGLVGLRLVESSNLAAGAAGIATLTALGALSTIPPGPPLGTDLPVDPCPLPPDTFIGNFPLMLLRIVQRSLCLTRWAQTQHQNKVKDKQNLGGYGGWYSP